MFFRIKNQFKNQYSAEIDGYHEDWFFMVKVFKFYYLKKQDDIPY